MKRILCGLLVALMLVVPFVAMTPVQAEMAEYPYCSDGDQSTSTYSDSECGVNGVMDCAWYQELWGIITGDYSGCDINYCLKCVIVD